MSRLEEYYTKWKIKINSNKTQAIFFTRKRKHCFLPNRNLTLLGSDINWSDNIRYLGITLDPKLTFNSHISSIIDKVNNYRKILYPLINRNSLLNNPNKILIVKAIFQAIILYGCPVWGSCAKTHIKRLQIAQNKILKMALKLPWHFSTSKLHLDNNVKTVPQAIEILTSRFRSKCSFSENPLISSLY